MDHLQHATQLKQLSNEGMCVHGVTKDSCSFCSGLYESKNRQVRERREQLEDISDIKKKYELMRKYENHGEDWSEEEYEVVYDKFKGIVSVKSPQFRKLAYEVAIELGRTRKSIVWHFKHMFILQDNPKAGEKLLEFKRKVGLTR